MKKASWDDERGNVLVTVAFLAVILLGSAALVTDVGMLYVERRQMVTAADAAALAGAREMMLTGDEAAAVETARAYAQANGASITDQIAVETINHNGETFRAIVATVGVNREYLFARVLGFTDQDVIARSVATWGYPTSFLNILPFFYMLPEGDALPEGEVLVLDREVYAPGNLGFLRADSPGKKTINDILEGADSGMFLSINDENIHFDTETGNPQSRIGAVEKRLQAANDPATGVSMKGVIPIIREITGQGHTTVIVVGFAYYEILDVVTEVTKEEDDLWYGRGSIYAHYLDAPRLYSVYDEGYNIKKEADDDYPKGTIVGRFLDESMIPSRHFIEISQNPEHDFGISVVKLIH